MWSKGFLITTTVLVFSQAVQNNEKKLIDQRVPNGEFVIIDNATYFMDMVTGFHREDAKTTCESLNMTMIRFEGEEQKWLAIEKYFTEEDIVRYFWTDAVRDEGSIEWYWETSGNIIADNDLYWAPRQPSMENSTVRLCISFSNYVGGYDDDDCLYYRLDIMCQ